MSVATETTFQVPFLPEAAHQITFDNGHTFVFVPKQGGVFNLSTWVRTGSIHEDDVNNGVSHFLEHLMFKGTERHKPGEFDRAMESMGAIINAATWKDFTFYYVTGPNNDDGNSFAKALDMHADMLLHSTLPDGEIGPTYDPEDSNYAGEKRERSVVIEEIGMREDQPWTKVYNSVNNLMYPEGHPYQRDVIGTRSIIGAIERKSIEAYYRRWYSPNQMTTIVVGDFDVKALTAQVRKAFDFETIATSDALSGYTEPPNPMAFAGKQNTESARYEELKGDFATNFFIMGYHGPAIDDLKSWIALDIAGHVLGEGRSSRLVQRLIEQADTPNFNSLGCGQSDFTLGNTFYVQGNFLSSNVQGSLDEVKAEIDRFLADEPITQDEFDRAVKSLKVAFAETSETSSGIAESIGNALTVSGSLDSYVKYLDVLKSIDRETVIETANRFLASNNSYTAALTAA